MDVFAAKNYPQTIHDAKGEAQVFKKLANSISKVLFFLFFIYSIFYYL